MIAQKCSTRHLKYAAGCDLREEHSRGGGEGGRRPGAADILGGDILCWFLGIGGKELLFHTLSAGLLKAEWLRMTVLDNIAWIWILVLLFSVDFQNLLCQKTWDSLRPYHPERAGSCLISEAKQGRAWLVLGWEKIWDKDGYLLYSITTQVKWLNICKRA